METLTLTTAGAALAAASAIANRLKQLPCEEGLSAEESFAVDSGRGNALETLTIGVKFSSLQPSQQDTNCSQ